VFLWWWRPERFNPMEVSSAGVRLYMLNRVSTQLWLSHPPERCHSPPIQWWVDC
jgi:hypothetical protein